MLGWVDPGTPAALNRIKRGVENAWMDVSQPSMKLSLPQVGGRRWVEFFFALKGNLLILIPKTPIRLTD